MAYQVTCESVPLPAHETAYGVEFTHEVISCPGGWTITEVSAGFFPPLTESEAYMVATAVALLFATVFGIRQLRRVIR